MAPCWQVVEDSQPKNVPPVTSCTGALPVVEGATADVEMHVAHASELEWLVEAQAA